MWLKLQLAAWMPLHLTPTTNTKAALAAYTQGDQAWAIAHQDKLFSSRTQSWRIP